MPTLTLLALLFAFVCACTESYPVTPQGRLERARAQLSHAATRSEQFYALNDLAKESFVLGKSDDARAYAQELLRLAPDYTSNWNYGNAIHDGNMVLGRIALKEGRMEDAKKLLIEAGLTPGSPQLDTFGPNMSLARDLLEKGERDVVLKYLEACGKFWEMEGGCLARWADTIRAGRVPDFDENLD